MIWTAGGLVALLTLLVSSRRRHHRLHLRCAPATTPPHSPRLIHAPGTVNIFRYGAGTNGIMRTLGQYMAGSGATFGGVGPFRIPPPPTC